MRRQEISSVDVVVFSHNCENFIAEALEGVFAQECSAKVTIRVLDDASTDGSVDQIRRVLSNSPFGHALTVNSTNQYQTGSLFKYKFLSSTQSEFIAVLDGDDFWSDPLKIESQVEMMRSNPDVSLCHSDFYVMDETGGLSLQRPPVKFRKPKVRGRVLARGNIIGTVTVLLRRSALPTHFPSSFNSLAGVDDYPIWALTTQNSYIGYVDRPTGVYRLHSSSNYSSQPQAVKELQTREASEWIRDSLHGMEKISWTLESARAQMRHTLRSLLTRGRDSA